MYNRKAVTHVSWTNLELTGLLEDEDSCVYLKRVKKHLGLYPYHLTNLNAALHDILNTNVNFYDPELNGLVLTYKNLKLLSPLGDILHDTCFVHVDIEADFYIFRPEIGHNLKGFVNKKGTNHIVILVHKVFNVSIPKPDKDNDEWIGHKVKVGQEVKFRTEEINCNIKIPYIRGSLHEEEYLSGCQLFNEEIAATCGTEFEEMTRWNGSEESSDLKKLTVKTENKRIFFDSDSNDDEDISENKPSVVKLKSQTNISQESMQTMSKKRKLKSSLSSESDSQKSDKEQKIKIKKDILIKNSNNSELEKSNNSQRKRKKNNVESSESQNDTENENYKRKNESQSDKLLSKNSTNQSIHDDSLNDNNEVIKKLKKRKKKLSINDDIEEEKLHKSHNKTQKIIFDDANEAESEKELSETSVKKRKIKSQCVDTEDEKDYKFSIKKNLTKSILNDSKSESEFDDANEAKSEKELSETSVKKRKKKSQCVDTEDEKDYKFSIKKNLMKSILNDSKSESETESTKKPKKKQKTKFFECIDTDDEKHYKSLIKKNLIQPVSDDSNKIDLQSLKTLENDSEAEFKTLQSPSKKRKKRHSKTEVNKDFEEKEQHKEEKYMTVHNHELMDTEDERNYKASIKKLIKNMQNEDEKDDFAYKEPKKKKHKRKHATEVDKSEFHPISIKIKQEPNDESFKNISEEFNSVIKMEEEQTRRKLKKEKDNNKSSK